MLTLSQALSAVKVGDIVFGFEASGQDKLLLVYKVDPSGFSARQVTTQVSYRFGRDGKTPVHSGGRQIAIVSTARLPQDMYDVALGLDRKWAARPEYPDSILTPAEIQLILTHDKFFRQRLLPGTDSIVRAADKCVAVRNLLELEWDPLDVRDNPPMSSEYLDDLPALVDLLDRPGSVDEVTDFLTGMASRRMRSGAVGGRSRAAAISLLQLGRGWT